MCNVLLDKIIEIFSIFHQHGWNIIILLEYFYYLSVSSIIFSPQAFQVDSYFFDSGFGVFCP